MVARTVVYIFEVQHDVVHDYARDMRLIYLPWWPREVKSRVAVADSFTHKCHQCKRSIKRLGQTLQAILPSLLTLATLGSVPQIGSHRVAQGGQGKKGQVQTYLDKVGHLLNCKQSKRGQEPQFFIKTLCNVSTI